MPYSTSNKQIQDSAFKLKSGNTSPFKQMGASPLKQDYVKDIFHKKYNPSGTINRPTKKIYKGLGDVINKEVTRIGKGGTVKAKQVLADAAKKRAADIAKKTASKSWWKRLGGKLGGKAVATLGMYFGSMDTAKATQPGTGKHGGTKIGTYNPETGKYQ